MKSSVYKLVASVCLALLLGACATTTAETSANKEVDQAAGDTAEIGYDVPINGKLVPQAGKYYSKEEDDRVVCRRIQVTGSKFQKKVCMTWAEWKEREAQGKEFMRDHNRRARQQANPQGG